MNSRACKAGALPAELQAHDNHMILIDVLENDYLLNTYCRSRRSRKLGYAAHAVQPLSFR
jgi:hypothetical protein